MEDGSKKELSEEEVRDTFLYWEEFGLVSILSEEPFSVRYLPLASGAKPRKIKPEKYAAFSESAPQVSGSVSKFKLDRALANASGFRLYAHASNDCSVPLAITVSVTVSVIIQPEVPYRIG